MSLQSASQTPQQQHTPAHRHAQVSAHAQHWSQGRAELWTRSSSAVGWPRMQTRILIVAKAFLSPSSPVGTVLGDSSRQSVFRPEPGRGHLGVSPRGWGVLRPLATTPLCRARENGAVSLRTRRRRRRRGCYGQHVTRIPAS